MFIFTHRSILYTLSLVSVGHNKKASKDLKHPNNFTSGDLYLLILVPNRCRIFFLSFFRAKINSVPMTILPITIHVP